MASVTDSAANARFDPIIETRLGVIALLTIGFAASLLLMDEVRASTLASLMLLYAIIGLLILRVALRPAQNALDKEKQFVGNVAHEIRTPLAVIRTNAEVALLSHTLPDEMRTMLQSSVEELDRISAIINNLLSLSATRQHERIEFSSVDFGHVVEAALNRLEGLARARNLNVTLRRGGHTQVWGNTTALDHIVSHIVKNAIMNTARHGSVAISVEERASGVECTVQDSGIGIARTDLFRIFEPFYRADVSRTRSSGGSGLGLAIVSELVKLHRGRIGVRSALGRGTTVTVIIPAHVSGDTVRRNTSDEVSIDYTHRYR